MAKRRRKRRKNKSNKNKLLITLLVLAVFVCSYGFASGWYFPNPLGIAGLFGSGDPVDAGKGDPDQKDTPDLEGFTVLLMGTDNRESDSMDTRTDTMMVMNYNDQEQLVSLLSVPRDTRVPMPGHWTDKVNAANVYGGPELAVKTVSQFLDIPIDYYILTNFYGFKDIVDALGGVELTVEQDMYRPPEKNSGNRFGIDLEKGKQELNGDKALQYVRYRGGPQADIGRTQRQLKFLKALARETMQAKTITKLPKLVPEINKNVKTNMGLTQLFQLAKAGKNLDSLEIKTQTLPGHYLVAEDGINYWSVDREQAQEVASALFEDGKVIENIVQGPVEDLRPVEEENNTQVSQNNRDEEGSGDSSDGDTPANLDQGPGSDTSSGSAGEDNPGSGGNEEDSSSGGEETSRDGEQDSQPGSGEDGEPAAGEGESSNGAGSTQPEGLPVEEEPAGKDNNDGQEDGNGDNVEIIIETSGTSM